MLRGTVTLSADSATVLLQRYSGSVMGIFQSVGSTAIRRLGWPGARPRRPSLLGWPGVVDQPGDPGEQAVEIAVSRETGGKDGLGVSRGTITGGVASAPPEDHPNGRGLAEVAAPRSESHQHELVDIAGPIDSPVQLAADPELSESALASTTQTDEPVLSADERADTQSTSDAGETGEDAQSALAGQYSLPNAGGDGHMDIPSTSLDAAPTDGSHEPAAELSPNSSDDEIGSEPAPLSGTKSVGAETPSHPGSVDVPDVVEADASAPAPIDPPVVRPPGPRRAKFDRDEFDTDPGSDEPSVPAAERTRLGVKLPAPPQTRIFVVANQKGGVGKTTTSVNLAAALALGGLNVLVLDLDPQGNASTALGIDHEPGIPGTYEVLIEGAAIEDHLVASPEASQLRVLPATIDLAGAEIQLVSAVARENRLRKALRTYLADHPVDYVFLDCPPSLGLITLNALVAATEILIPIQCEYYALEGVSQLVRTINLVKGELNEELEVSTVLLTMYDARTRLAAQVAEEVRSYFTGQTLPTVIPRSVRISEAPSYGQTVLTYHPDSAGAVSYLEAAQEIARRGASPEAM